MRSWHAVRAGEGLDIQDEWPLLIAANRDEFFARPAEPPQVIQARPLIVGGRDLKAGGTWMGATGDGFVVGLTNQRSYSRADPARRSRGAVVLGALRAGGPRRAARWLRALDPRDFNPFNLLFGHAHDVRVAYAHPQQGEVRIEHVEPGIHVLPNDVLDSAAFPKVARARALLAESAPTVVFEQMLRCLGDRVIPERLPPEPAAGLPESIRGSLNALCVVTPVYGTCSATAIALAPGRVERYLFADGAPHVTPFEDYTALFRR